MKIIDSELRLAPQSAHSKDFPLKYLSEGVIRDIFADPNIDVKIWEPERLSDEISRSGVSGGVISGLAWSDRTLQEENNELVKDFCSSSPNMKAFYMPSFKQSRKEWISSIESLDRSIFVGIEIIPKWHKISTNNSDFYYLLKVAEEMDLYVKVYTCHPTQSFSGNTVIETFKMIIDNPSSRFVIPHSGGGLPLYQLDTRYSEILGKCLFLASISSTMRMCKYFLDINDKNLLFASDFPFNHCKNIQGVIDSTLDLGLSQDQLNRFLYKNASQAFNIKL